MFDRRPDEVWRWYLYRFGVCLRAEPNAGHRALVDLDRARGVALVHLLDARDPEGYRRRQADLYRRYYG